MPHHSLVGTTQPNGGMATIGATSRGNRPPEDPIHDVLEVI